MQCCCCAELNDCQKKNENIASRPSLHLVSSRLPFPDRLSSRVFIFILHKLRGEHNHSLRGRRDLLVVTSHLTRHVDSKQIVSDKDVLLEIQLKKSALLGARAKFASDSLTSTYRFASVLSTTRAAFQAPKTCSGDVADVVSIPGRCGGVNTFQYRRKAERQALLNSRPTRRFISG